MDTPMDQIYWHLKIYDEWMNEWMHILDDQFRLSLDSLDGVWLSVALSQVIDQRVNTLFLQV